MFRLLLFSWSIVVQAKAHTLAVSQSICTSEAPGKAKLFVLASRRHVKQARGFQALHTRQSALCSLCTTACAQQMCKPGVPQRPSCAPKAMLVSMSLRKICCWHCIFSDDVLRCPFVHCTKQTTVAGRKRVKAPVA